MSLIDTVEQKAFGAAVRRLIESESPLSTVRSVVEGGAAFDSELWRSMATLGLPSILIPEQFGGSSGAAGDLAVALRELGRGLVPSPLLATLLSAQVLLCLDDVELKADLLPQMVVGDLIVTLAVGDGGSGGWNAEPRTTATAPEAGRSVLNGVIPGVLNGGQADLFLVHAQADTGIAGIYLVAAEAPGVRVTREDNLDLTRSTAVLHLTNSPAAPIAGEPSDSLEAATDLANLAMACTQSAAMKRAIEVTAAYATMRYSFGQPIGSYQGVKHKLADLYTEWCLVDAAVRRAVEARDAGEPEARTCAAAARVLSSPAYLRAAKQMMMLHGGIGFTWEHDAHLFYKNAVSDRALFGGPAVQSARLGRLLAARQ